MRTLQVTYIFGSPSFSSSSLWLIFILQLEGDDRSDEEEDDTDSPKEKKHKLSHINGSGIRGRASGHWHMQIDRNLEKGKWTADTWTDYIWIAAVRIELHVKKSKYASAENIILKGTVKDYN